MKSAYKYLSVTGLMCLLCLFLIDPANAQRGGGGHGGGGGGGGHAGGGFSGGGGGHAGGFSGGGARGGGFSGGGHYGISGTRGLSSPQHFSGFQRGGSPQRAGTVNRGNLQGYRGNSYAGRPGINGNTRSYAGARGVTGTRSYATTGVRGYVGGVRSYGAAHYYGPSYWGGRGYWGYHGGYYWHGGYYGSLYWPYIGIGYGYLPYGYYPFYWGGIPYYYSNGFYYQYNNDQYTVVEPPLGAEIAQLPSGAQPITINGGQYYELNGVYYQAVTKDDGSTVYVIAGKDGQLNTGNGGDQGNAAPAPQIGDIYDQLPPDTRKIKLNGVTFYVSPDDYYYQETTATNGNKVYKVVGTPSDEPGN